MPPKLGQHFLVSEPILEQLAVAACGEHAARVIEIGPGKGALTRKLLPKTDELHAVELDGKLVKHLEQRFSCEPKLHVHSGDILETDLAQWGPGIITGNLPYYITSPIMERFLDLPDTFGSAVFLMQYEVAQRLLAKPGTRDYGYLTVCTQLLCETELVCKVPASAFAPPPKVDSAAVRLVRRKGRPVQYPEIRKLASRAFAHKRKTLRNNLKPFYGGRMDGLAGAGLRAEQLPVAGFIELLQELQGTPTEPLESK